ncbi:MAG: AAA family ATPase [Planctomycetes bacterium]|nr:AAA family ATPase [Planctomycetota bacterium]
MNWDQARKLLRLARTRSESADAARASVDHARHELGAAPRAHSLCIASGKGGTGKSVVSASLGTLFARRGRTLLVDADLGVGNAHILHDLCPPHSFVDVIEGRLSVRDIRVNARPQLDLLAGGSGVSRMAGLSPYELHLVAVGIESVEQEYRHVLVDSAAGISNQTIAFAAASDVVLIVTTPDVTALTDAYAFLKVLLQRRGELVPLFVVNRATCEEEALHVADRLRGVARKFLGREPRYLGWLPDDRHVVECVNARSPVVARAADAPFSQAVTELSVRMQQEFARVPARGVGRSMLRSVGYTPGLG